MCKIKMSEMIESEWNKIYEVSDRLLKSNPEEQNIYKSHLVQAIISGSKLQDKLEAIKNWIKNRPEPLFVDEHSSPYISEVAWGNWIEECPYPDLLGVEE